MYGLFVCDFGGSAQEDVSFGNHAEIVEAKTVNQIRPIHFGVNYHEDPLEFPLVFGANRNLDRYEMQSVALWLTGHQNYQWLQIDQPDMQNVLYHCLITDLQPITVGWIPHAFRATIRCDCPYAYSQEFEQTYNITDKTEILFRNESTIHDYFKPRLTIKPASGVTDITISNTSDNDRTLQFTDLPASNIEIFMDNEHGIITETSGYNLYDNFNMNFFRCVYGDNILEVDGNCEITISGRFLYNVAG